MECITKIPLRYGDTDQMGIIYHANHITFFEIARIDFLHKLGFDYAEVEEDGILFPIRNVSCTYLKSILFKEEIYVKTRIEEFNKIKITYIHEIYNQDDELKAKGTSTIVCVDKATFSLKKMDEVLPEFYNKMLNEEYISK